MSDFPGIAEDIYKYQNQFDYSVWTPNTSIMCCNVPWDSSYRDIVRFDSESARDDYFASLADQSFHLDLSHLVYLRYGDPVRINAPFSAVAHCNYLVVHNPLQPVPGPSRVPDTFYYFINDVTYIAPNTTQLNIQLDVWQTYYQYAHFGLTYVVEGHAGIANENVTIDDEQSLLTYLNEPEGLDLGSELMMTRQQFINFAPYNDDNVPWVVFLCSANLADDDWGDKSNPEIKTSSGGAVMGAYSGISCLCCSVQDFSNVMNGLKDYPWVTQCISFMAIVPAVMVETQEVYTTINNAEIYTFNPTAKPVAEYPIYNVMQGFSVDAMFNGRYKGLKKFWTYPYAALELTALCGGEIVLKPQNMDIIDGDATLCVQSSVCPPDMRIVAYPKYYNAGVRYRDIAPSSWNAAGLFQESTFFSGENLDMAVVITDFPQISIANDSYALYLASTQHQRAYQYSTADWAQQKAMTAARLAYSQASASMDAQRMNTGVQNWATQQNAAIAQNRNIGNTVVGAEKQLVNGITGAASSGSGAGAALAAATTANDIAMSAVSTAMQNQYIQQQAGVSMAAASGSLNNNLALQRYNRDTNYDYAAYAANGDYQNAIQGILAKVQDAAITQPTTSGQIGGKLFNWANGYTGILIKWKFIQPGAMRTIGEYWLRYGYYVNRFFQPPQDLKVMSNFSYWKMQEVYLTDSADGVTRIPETFKATIRGIFEKGVTVWNDPAKIGNIDLADNDPVEGFSYE